LREIEVLNEGLPQEAANACRRQNALQAESAFRAAGRTV